MKLSLKAKLLLTGISTIILPLGLVFIVNQQASQSLRESTALALKSQAEESIGDLVKDIWDMVRNANEMLKERMASTLSMGDSILEDLGGLSFDSSDKVTWTAVNQYTKSTLQISLPQVKLKGETWLGKVSSSSEYVPLIDRVSNATQATATVFQRINDSGDMLRVATSVIKKDGTRAIGTYIPATNPDGVSNPVIAKVLSGETYLGRAYVVDGWYVTAYKPLFDDDGEVVGVFYVGLPEATAQALVRKAILDVKVGYSGRAFVLAGKGEKRGAYVISETGEHDGMNVWDTEDKNGKKYIQDMINEAVLLDEKERGSVRYAILDETASEPREKFSQFAYYEPWDWVIGAGIYLDELLEPVVEIDKRAEAASNMIIAIIIASTLAGVIVFYVIASATARRLSTVSQYLNNCCDETSRAAESVSNSCQQLAMGASQQAAGLEQSASSLEEISAQTQDNTASVQEVDTLVAETRRNVDDANARMQELSESIQGIVNVSEETRDIVKTIDEIAFQTNILALNAAVEAARAGEAGAGFAVVADEVRSLAQRSAKAAQSTGSLISASVEKAQQGKAFAEQVHESFDRVSVNADSVSDHVARIAESSKEQSKGIELVSSSVHEIESIIQDNTRSTESSAAAAEELFGQSEQLKSYVRDLQCIIAGGSGSSLGVVSAARKASGLSEFSHAESASVSSGESPDSKTQGVNDLWIDAIGHR